MSVIHQLMATAETIEGWDVVKYSNELFFDYRKAQDHLDKFEKEVIASPDERIVPDTVRIQIIDRKLCDRKLRAPNPISKRGDKL